MDPYGPHQHCLFIVSPKVHHLGSFRPVWASKQGEIGLKSAPNALLWGLRFASDLPPIGLQMALNGPKWPPMAPNGPRAAISLNYIHVYFPRVYGLMASVLP